MLCTVRNTTVRAKEMRGEEPGLIRVGYDLKESCFSVLMDIVCEKPTNSIYRQPTISSTEEHGMKNSFCL